MIKIPIALAGPGDKPIVGAQPGQGVRVMGAFLIATDETTLTIMGGPTALSGALKLRAGDQIKLDFQQVGHVETPNGQPLVFNLQGNKAALNGWLHWMPI